jgi:nucleoside 2-deoxyribosyltransferase
MLIYLAGPLFTLAERRFNRELAAALESAGPEVSVILPQQHDHDHEHDTAEGAKRIFERCLRDLGRAEAVVAVLDGPDADAGTAFECGYCYARKVPVVCLRTDIRGGAEPVVNAMLRRSASAWLEVSPVGADLDRVAEKVLAGLAGAGKGES